MEDKLRQLHASYLSQDFRLRILEEENEALQAIVRNLLQHHERSRLLYRQTPGSL